mmetsp:Transcript_9993/g.40516  ORF Transcript_9993/g.40516 Transcript_9993/m.40516 type:complete len:484 (-) Transcript_9993:171-1622(-)
MAHDAGKFVYSCPICQFAKKQTPNRRHGALHPIYYDAPMHTVSIDVVGLFSPPLRRGNKYVFVVVDNNFSNYIWLTATPDETAETTASLLLDLFLQFGFPRRVLSDRGSNFLADVTTELLRLLRVKTARTSSYHPETDGKNEVSHRLLLSQVRAFIQNADYAAWDDLLQFFAFAANSAPLDGVPYSPFQLLLGRTARSPTDQAASPSDPLNVFDCTSTEVRTSFGLELRDRLRRAREFMLAFRKRQQAAWIARRDAAMAPTTFDIGDYVIVHSPKHTKGISTKLINQFQGPYRIVGKHQLDDGSAAPNVFDLEHVRIRNPLAGVNITRLHRYRPGSDFIVLDFDAASSTTPPSPPSSAPTLLTDDFAIDDMVVVRHPDRADDFAVGKVLHVYDANEISLHYWGAPSGNLLKSTLKPEFYDPNDGLSLFTDRPLARHSPAVSLFAVSDVLSTPFVSTKRKTLPTAVLKDLSRLEMVCLVLVAPT